MKTPKSLRARALDLLSRREVSRAELKRKLAPYAENEEEVDAVLAEFAEKNWQSDRRYAEAYIHSKSSRQGRIRLKQALSAQGVDAETIAGLLPDAGEELTHAAAVMRKKFRQPPQSAAEKQKYLRFLLYRGFAADTALKALKQGWQEEAEEE